MKRIVLTLTLLCAGALNGMEEWITSPQDIRYVIITQALKTSNNPNEAIKALKSFSAVQGIQFDKLFGNQKDFTKVVHMLADKFDMTTKSIAQKFGTPTAKIYLDLVDALLNATSKKYPFNKNEFEDLIVKGADVNFSNDQGTLLKKAIFHSNVEAVKILLNAGASPDPELITDLERKISFYESIMPSGESQKEATTIKKMIDEVLKKQP